MNSVLITIAGWYLIVLGAGTIGYRFLNRLGMQHDEAWASGRVLGLAFVVFIPWWYHFFRLIQYEFLILAAATAWIVRRRRLRPVTRAWNPCIMCRPHPR